MTLSNRAIFLIVPVLLLSYAAAALTVYFALERRVTALEQTRLDLAATELSSAFSSYSTFAESYLLSLTENDAFRNLVKSKHDVFMNVTLGASIEENIRSYTQHQSNKLSFLVAQREPEIKELYYFELSDDPFASTNPLQKESYLNFIDRNLSESWDFVEEGGKDAMIIVTRAIDQQTFKRPIQTQIAESLVVQFALEPSSFLKLREQILIDYDASISITDQSSIESTKLHTIKPIGPNKFLLIMAPHSYLQSILVSTQIALFVISVLFFIFSSVLLYKLVSQFITGPIHDLEAELSDVINHNKDKLELQYQKDDEIGRLGKTFQSVYGALSDSYKKVKDLAEHDPLTKLHNLAYVTNSAQKALRDAEQHHKKVALIYIDLDNFKFVNDKYGHNVGDALLKSFASRLTNVTRNADLIFGATSGLSTHGRIAGDEFAVILADYLDDSVPGSVAKRILSIFDNGFTFEQGTFPVSVSIGIAIYPEDGHTLTQLVSNADNAMYQAKNSGKNGIAFYSKELATHMRRRMDIENELKAISMDDEFYLVFMPLICTHSNKIDGYEVLLRWESSVLGFVGPDEFIPIAEASGVFSQIDDWVAESALRSYAELQAKLGYDFKLSINLSSAQLNVNKIAERLAELAKRYSVEPKFIQLEMTETLNVEFTKKAKSLLNALCLEGFQIAIDDFGTGYTALLQLIEYPAHMIKFDKFLVDKAMQPDNREMLKPLISLCHSQGLKVTAEGVETKQTAEYLASIGCDYLQGYLFGKPARIEDLNTSIELESLISLN